MCILKYTNKSLKQRIKYESGFKQPYVCRHPKLRQTDNHEFCPFSAAVATPFDLKKFPEQSPRTMQFAFPFELRNYIKYIHKLFYGVKD